MGIGFVLILWAVLGTVLAVIGAGVMVLVAGFFTRGCHGRRKVIVAASILPFACLGWAALIFVFQAVINEGYLHRDPGLGDDWHCPLPNGYELLMIDVTDHGYVYNPKTQSVEDSVVEQEDAPGNIRLLQVTGPFFMGGSDSKAMEDESSDNRRVDSYFFLDSRTGKRTNFADYESLKNATTRAGILLNLQPIGEVYSKYRFTWFDVFAGLLFVIPPLAGGVVLILWILRVRRFREMEFA